MKFWVTKYALTMGIQEVEADDPASSQFPAVLCVKDRRPGYFHQTFHGNDWLTGGKLGPEASLLVFPVIAAMFVAFHFLYRARAPFGAANNNH